jgi:hypothetical protein
MHTTRRSRHRRSIIIFDQYGPELYVTANAASDPAGNEANATTGWSTADVTLTSDGTIKAFGSYSLKSVFTGAGGTSYIDLNAILTTGKTYLVTCNARHLGSGGNSRVSLGSVPLAQDGGNLVILANTDVTFTEYSKQFVHSATTRYFGTAEISATNDGGTYLDNISIREVL